VTVTTDISYDHMDVLGDTLEKIAAEKGGIIKPGVPHVTGLLPQSAQRVLRGIASQVGAPFLGVDARRLTLRPEQLALDYITGNLAVTNLRPSLLGEHQLRNTAVVLEVTEVLRSLGLRLSRTAVERGIRSTQWRGRFQVLSHRGKPTIILDVCHNAAGAVAFATTFSHLYPGRKAPIIVGFVQKKEHQKMFDALSIVASEYLLVKLKSHRSIDLDETIRSVDLRGVPVRAYRSLASALSALVKQADSDDIIPVIGSHYLVGEFLGRYT
jgi:dihydrofolate synthase/folylpolyglutamate synthase